MNRWLSDRTITHLRTVTDRPDLSGSKYRLLAALGRGGMASVYAAEDVELGREVALKITLTLDPDGSLAERLLREARILARLEHPGIVPVHDVGRLPDGRIFYVMKWVRGRRLDEMLPEMPELDARLRIFERICEAVAFAHAHGVVHRDLKPENIMAGQFGEVLVMDWGVAKVLRESDIATAQRSTQTAQDTPFTQDGTRVGTPGFMAPEQVRGERESVDARTDVWGLGAILHVLLHGSLPGGPAVSSRGTVPRPLHAVLERALAQEPSQRYADADALAEDVRRFRAGATPSAYREPLLERAGRVVWKYRTPVALVLTYVLMRLLLLF